MLGFIEQNARRGPPGLIGMHRITSLLPSLAFLFLVESLAQTSHDRTHSDWDRLNLLEVSWRRSLGLKRQLEDTGILQPSPMPREEV